MKTMCRFEQKEGTMEVVTAYYASGNNYEYRYIHGTTDLSYSEWLEMVKNSTKNSSILDTRYV